MTQRDKLLNVKKARAGILILFAGGDAGGFWLGPNGIEPVPPFEPKIASAIERTNTVMSEYSALESSAERRRTLSSARKTLKPAIARMNFAK